MRRLYLFGLSWVTATVATLGLVIFLAGALAYHWVEPAFSDEKELSKTLETFFAERAASLVSGDSQALSRFYDETAISGRYAHEHETARVKYTSAWFRERHVLVARIEPTLRVIALGSEGDKAWASVCQQLLFTYRHGAESPNSRNIMGTRTIHWVELSRRGGKWLVQRDWFWDPFKDDTPCTDVDPFSMEPNSAGNGAKPLPSKSGETAPGKYERDKAAAYADRYCGIRISGSGGRYNLDYRDFTGVGGDCANFVSQVLSDQTGGGMPQDWTWFSQGNTASVSWLRADYLVDYLLANGRAVLVGKGSIKDVSSDAGNKSGPIFSLQPGDVIGYARKGAIVHVSVVVAKDSSGYPVVDSHSGDRYHVPWDLGYDANTKYWLLHIVY